MLIKRGRVWQSRIMVAGFLQQKSLKTRDKRGALGSFDPLVVFPFHGWIFPRDAHFQMALSQESL